MSIITSARRRAARRFAPSAHRPPQTTGDAVSERVVLRADDGSLLPLDPDRWHGEANLVELDLLHDIDGPVLDVGCGPGRLVVGLAERGIPALGVDSAPAAIELARGRGASVLHRSVFDPLPGEGRWKTILLLDGNVGIGGNPVRLLARCAELLAPGGTVIAEVARPGTPTVDLRARLERNGASGTWFPWSVVGADAIGELSSIAGLPTMDLTRAVDHSVDDPADRWFAHLNSSEVDARACR